jgi:hypothetical protein
MVAIQMSNGIQYSGSSRKRHFPEGNILPARKRAGAAWHLGMFLVVGLKAFEIETLYDIEDSITDLEKRT